MAAYTRTDAWISQNHPEWYQKRVPSDYAALYARRLPAASGPNHYTGSGALVAPAATISAVTDVPDPTIWETDNLPWGAADFVYADDKPVMIIGNEFYQADRDLRFGETALRVVLMRSGLTIMGRDRFGNWKADPTTTKELTGLWPIIRGVPGTRINIYAGAQDSTDDPIRWEGPFPFIIGTTTFCDFTVSGRYLAVRFESQDVEPWELLSYDLDLEVIGERG
jgi:hypothetical protein